jgi:hypothetical protein
LVILTIRHTLLLLLKDDLPLVTVASLVLLHTIKAGNTLPDIEMTFCPVIHFVKRGKKGRRPDVRDKRYDIVPVDAPVCLNAECGHSYRHTKPPHLEREFLSLVKR